MPSLASQNGSLLSEMRHDFLGKQRHRLLHKRGVHQPSLVEIADELVKTIFGLQLPNPRDAIFGVAEHAHLAVHIGISDALHAGPHLAERLEALRVALNRWQRRFGGHPQKAQQARLAFRAGLRPAARNVHRKRQRGVVQGAGGQTLAVDDKAGLELVRRVDQRRREDR